MAYKKGDLWTGNPNGRPKKPDFRAKFTQELVEANFDNTKNIVGSIARFAMDGEQWALKLYCTTMLPYSLLKPKAELDISSADLSTSQEAYTNLSKDAQALLVPHMEAIKKIMMGSNA